jgi:hypothetical protein
VQKAVQSKPFMLPVDKSGKANRGKPSAPETAQGAKAKK